VAYEYYERTKSGRFHYEHRMYVSDYDLMSFWRATTGGFQKVFMSAPGGRSRGGWSAEAIQTAARLNSMLISKIQHGCQDDYQSPNNPGVKFSDHFAGFRLGESEHMQNPLWCQKYYETKLGAAWPYGPSGRYTGTVY